MILKVIESLNPNKAHGHDGVAARLFNLSRLFIIKPLLIKFYNCLKIRTFADDWKKGNLAPVH